MKKDASQLIDEIGEIVKGMWGDSENPEGLRKALNDIAVLHWALSNWQTEFEAQEREAKADLELDKANILLEFVDAGEAVNKAEIRTTIKLGAKRKEYNKMASNLEKVKVMSRANERAMDSLRSQLATIRGEIK